jgi:hypothetical protein
LLTAAKLSDILVGAYDPQRRSEPMNDDVKLTLYMSPEMKEKIFAMAKSTRPKLTASALGVYLLELGLEKYQEETRNEHEGPGREGVT